jgi:hypothetical protein
MNTDAWNGSVTVPPAPEVPKSSAGAAAEHEAKIAKALADVAKANAELAAAEAG